MKKADYVFPIKGELSIHFGISVRDYIAIQAMVGLCANTRLIDRSFDEIADYAYEQADAMIKRSEK